MITLSAAVHEVFNFYAESHVNAAKSVGGHVFVEGKKVDVADYLLTAKEDSSFLTVSGTIKQQPTKRASNNQATRKQQASNNQATRKQQASNACT